MKKYYLDECPYEKPKITFKQVVIVFLCIVLAISLKSTIESISVIQTQIHYNEYLKKLETQKNEQGFASLSQINPDILAWITVEDVDLSVPIVKTQSKAEEDFYLDHGFDKKYNKLGCPYQPYIFSLENSNTMFVGHSSYTMSLFGNKTNQSLFGKLNAYIDQNKDYNFKIKLETAQGTYNYQIIGYFYFKITDTTSKNYQEVYNNIYCANNLSSEASFNKFIQTLNSHSMQRFDQQASYGDKLLTLFTCYYNLDYRTIVVAKSNLETSQKKD